MAKKVEHPYTSDDDGDFEPPVYARNEIRPLQLQYATRDTISLMPQFYYSGTMPDLSLRDIIVTWLDRHSTGAWQMTDIDSEPGTPRNLCVFIERLTDRRKFHEAFPAIPYVEDDYNNDTNAECMCLYHGLFAPPDPATNLDLWVKENEAIHLTPLNDTHILIRFKDEFAEVTCLERLGTNFSFDPEHDGYVTTMRNPETDHDNSFISWLLDNNDFEECTTPARYGLKSSDDPEEKTYILRWPAMQESFARDWGDCFRLIKTAITGEQIWRGSDQARKPDRTIPDAYTNYAQGRIEWAHVRSDAISPPAAPALNIT